MTYEEAVSCLRYKTPVIYTGPGSMGRPTAMAFRTSSGGIGAVVGHLRGSKESIGIITKIRRTTCVVESNLPRGIGGMNYGIKYLLRATPTELKIARLYNRTHLGNLKFTY